jgi:cyanophycin synthetase
MLLQETRIMRGPNMWSDKFKKLIVLKLDYSTCDNETVFELFTYLYKQLGRHQSAVNLKSDPLLSLTGLIAELIADIQPESKQFYFDAKLLGDHSYYALAGYENEDIAWEAADEILFRLESILKNKSPLPVTRLKKKFEYLHFKFKEGPSTSAIIEAARKRNIPVKKIAGGYVSFGQGKYQKRIAASISETTGRIAVEIAGDKDVTKRLLERASIPVPQGYLVKNERALREAAEELGFPLVVKPWNANKGKGVTSNITDYPALQRAYTLAVAYSNPVMIERHIQGNDFRFLVVGYKLIAVALRTPACVTGDGESTIQQLIDKTNADPARGSGHENILTKIEVDTFTEHILAEKNMSLETIIRKGECVFLKHTANLSTGGTAEDVTNEVHPENKLLAERVAKIIGLDICGIDIMAHDVKTPIIENGGAVLEVNAAPGLRMHCAPSKGNPCNVGDPIIELMYPKGSEGRIPIVAVTGTNGKTTTSRLMAFVAGLSGFDTGLTTTDGIYLNNTMISRGDCTGPKSASLILNEPSIDFAVLECARGGIIRSGLAFDVCDIAIVTNIAADHLGLKDIYTLEDLANVKSVVPRSVKPDGYALLNASDDFVFKMKNDLVCNVGLFSLDSENPRIKEHCEKGGIAITVSKNNDIVILHNNEEIYIENVVSIPLTLGGKAEFMTENILPVVLASYLLGFSIDKIKKALLDFKPSAEQTPGRLNVFKINKVNVLIDYAHNPHGLNAIGKFLSHISEQKKGIITGVGDRRNKDIVEMGQIAAGIFDEVIIRIDEDTRGRTGDEIAALLVKGLQEAERKIPYHIIPDSKNALRFAIETAGEGDYIMICADDVSDTIHITKELELEFSSK